MVLRSKKFCFLIIAWLIAAELPLPSAAQEATGGCHCFRNRTYDPADKFAADDYLLTTTTNSLLASRFDISKRLIVMMKMKGGVANTDLLIGLHLAEAAHSDVGHILTLKGAASWRNALRKKSELSRISESDPVARQLREGLPDAEAGREIIAGVLAQKFSVAPETMQELENRPLSIKETALVLTLADYSGAPSDAIASFHQNGRSWSEIAHNFGLTPAGVGKLLLPDSEE